jgi:CHAD domain-containing protein
LRGKKNLEFRLAEVEISPLGGIHAVRVIVKILRAGMSYYRPKMAKFRKLDHRVKRQSRKLSLLRDVDARIELRAWLKEQGIEVNLPEAIAPAARPKEVKRQILVLVSECRKIISKLQREKSGSLSRGKRQLFLAIAAYQEDASNENLHRMRKQAKALRQQIHYFAPKHNAQHKDLDKSLSMITTDLGRVRDLQLLLLDRKVLKFKKALVQKLEKLEEDLTKKAVTDLMELKIDENDRPRT